MTNCQSFNPRTRVGCDKINVPQRKGNTVSIHAPVWGATTSSQRAKRLANVSIHAPVWGATPAASMDSHGNAVSIHAPVWGATTSPAMT